MVLALYSQEWMFSDINITALEKKYVNDLNCTHKIEWTKASVAFAMICREFDFVLLR